MYRLRLIKGKTYWGIVKASAENPIVDVSEKETAEQLVDSGYFEYVDGNIVNETEKEMPGEDESEEFDLFADDNSEDESATQEEPELAELHSKTKSQLVEYAEKHGIDAVGCKTKDDYIQRIVEAMAKAGASREEIRNI